MTLAVPRLAFGRARVQRLLRQRCRLRTRPRVSDGQGGWTTSPTPIEGPWEPCHVAQRDLQGDEADAAMGQLTSRVQFTVSLLTTSTVSPSAQLLLDDGRLLEVLAVAGPFTDELVREAQCVEINTR